MIESLKGLLKIKMPTYVVVEIGGFSFHVHIPVTTFDRIAKVGEVVSLLTYLNVKEDLLELYGFHSEQERELFRQLISISKIGPKTAIGIISGASPDEFKRRVMSGDVKALTNLPGIGPKTAKRIIVELKENFTTEDFQMLTGSSDVIPAEFEKAAGALEALGYRRKNIYSILSKISKDDNFEGTVEEIIKKALTKLT
tara:strand:- start:8926 stop:9519 length:594 start_codon:yes stop_codon:yes gene_type:complete